MGQTFVKAIGVRPSRFEFTCFGELHSHVPETDDAFIPLVMAAHRNLTLIARCYR